MSPLVESPGGPSPPSLRRPWTAAEDKALKEAISRYGSSRGPGSAWSSISACVPGRSNKDCRKRWFHSLDPSLKKGKWSAEEDEALKRLFKQMGPQWKEIALRIPGRKDDQVSKRWRDVLCPDLTPGKAWAPYEDAMLLQLLEEHGPKWATIAEVLPGRSPIACRNRSRKYHSLKADTESSPETVQQGSSSSQADSPAASATIPQSVERAATEVSWHLPSMPDLPDSAPTFNFDFSSLLEQKEGSSNDLLVQSGSSFNELSDQNDLLNSWLSEIPQVPDGAIGLPAPVQENGATQTLSLSAPAQPPDTTASPLYGSVAFPVSNTWSLVLALNSGQSSLQVSSDLLRKLLADAAANQTSQL